MADNRLFATSLPAFFFCSLLCEDLNERKSAQVVKKNQTLCFPSVGLC